MRVVIAPSYSIFSTVPFIHCLPSRSILSSLLGSFHSSPSHHYSCFTTTTILPFPPFLGLMSMCAAHSTSCTDFFLSLLVLTFSFIFFWRMCAPTQVRGHAPNFSDVHSHLFPHIWLPRSLAPTRVDWKKMIWSLGATHLFSNFFCYTYFILHWFFLWVVLTHSPANSENKKTMRGTHRRRRSHELSSHCI